MVGISPDTPQACLKARWRIHLYIYVSYMLLFKVIPIHTCMLNYVCHIAIACLVYDFGVAVFYQCILFIRIECGEIAAAMPSLFSTTLFGDMFWHLLGCSGLVPVNSLDVGTTYLCPICFTRLLWRSDSEVFNLSWTCGNMFSVFLRHAKPYIPTMIQIFI